MMVEVEGEPERGDIFASLQGTNKRSRRSRVNEENVTLAKGLGSVVERDG